MNALAEAPKNSTLVAPDASNLYRVDVFTDITAAEIKVLSPVHVHGGNDLSRKDRYFSSVKLTVGHQPIPCNFEIPAENLAEAIAKYVETAELAASNMLAQMEENQRRAAILGRGLVNAAGGPRALNG